MISRLLFLVFLLPNLVSASEVSWLEKDRFRLNFGAFNVNFDSVARVSGDTLGTRIRFEDALGLDDTDVVLRLDASYRFAERSSMQIEYTDLSRDGSNTIDRKIVIDDTTYTVGTRLDTSFDYQSLKLAYTHSVWQTSGYDIGLTAGLLIFDLDLKVESDTGLREGDGGTSPFPMFGLRGSWQLQPRLFLRAHLEYFTINEGDIDGQLEDYLVALEYRFNDGLGAGLGYNYLDLEVEDTDSRDEFFYEYDGLMLYLNLVY